MINRNITKILSLTAGLVFSSAPFAANWNVAVGDGGGSAQEALGIKFNEVLKEKTGGKHSTKLFLNGQLGSEQDTVNDAALRRTRFLNFSLKQPCTILPFTGYFIAALHF